MKKFIGSMVLGACLLTPVGVVVLQAQDHHAEHAWNDGENTYWHQYLKENHKKDHDWEKAKKNEQAAYWKWRDQHRDKH
jgi:hypothetical protein